jgi:hypothetical protein
LGFSNAATYLIYTLNLSKQELTLIKNHLLNKRMYRGAKLNLGTVVWEEWMDDFLKKIQKELDVKVLT